MAAFIRSNFTKKKESMDFKKSNVSADKSKEAEKKLEDKKKSKREIL